MTTHCGQSSRSSVDGHVGCFHPLASLSLAAMSICEQVCVDVRFRFSWAGSRSGISGSRVNSTTMGRTARLSSPVRAPLSAPARGVQGVPSLRLSPSSPTPVPAFLTLVILPGLRRRLTVRLICICPVTRDVEHLFRVLLGHLSIAFAEVSILFFSFLFEVSILERALYLKVIWKKKKKRK